MFFPAYTSPGFFGDVGRSAHLAGPAALSPKREGGGSTRRHVSRLVSPSTTTPSQSVLLLQEYCSVRITVFFRLPRPGRRFDGRGATDRPLGVFFFPPVVVVSRPAR